MIERPGESLSLREVLRRRRKLAAGEVAWLLRSLPAQLDAAEMEESGVPLLHEIVVHFPEPRAGLAEGEVRAWPHFTLTWHGSGTEAADVTRISTSAAASGPVRLAALIYELLGGRVRHEELLAGRYSPLGELGETGNAFLRGALAPGAFPAASAFWAAWVRSLPADEEARFVPLAGEAQPGMILELIPLDGGAAPTRLVAGPRFRIGRSRSLADLALRPSPELGRVHVTGELGPNGLAFRDGDGREPSVNGSSWCGLPLGVATALPLTGAGQLVLSPRGSRTAIEVTLLAAGRGGAAGLAQPFGAVAFRAAGEVPVAREALWLLSAIGAEGRAGGELAWKEEEKAAQAIRYRQGAFWIARRAEGGGVTVSERAVGPGEMAPLATGQTLTCDGFRWLVKVESGAFGLASPEIPCSS